MTVVGTVTEGLAGGVTLGGVTADTQDLANGNGGFVPKQGKYTIIYQANPFLTIDNNPK